MLASDQLFWWHLDQHRADLTPSAISSLENSMESNPSGLMGSTVYNEFVLPPKIRSGTQDRERRIWHSLFSRRKPLISRQYFVGFAGEGRYQTGASG